MIVRFLTFGRSMYALFCQINWQLKKQTSCFQVSDGKILEDEVPVFLVTFATQEMLVFRNAKTAEVVVGAENKVEQCTYVAAITRAPEELDNELTGGWKVIEVRLGS